MDCTVHKTTSVLVHLPCFCRMISPLSIHITYIFQQNLGHHTSSMSRSPHRINSVKRPHQPCHLDQLKLPQFIHPTGPKLIALPGYGPMDWTPHDGRGGPVGTNHNLWIKASVQWWLLRQSGETKARTTQDNLKKTAKNSSLHSITIH